MVTGALQGSLGLLKISGTLSELNVILAGAGAVILTDLPHLTAYKTHFHPFLMKNYMVFKALVLEMKAKSRRWLERAGSSLYLQNISTPCKTALKVFSINV